MNFEILMVYQKVFANTMYILIGIVVTIVIIGLCYNKIKHGKFYEDEKPHKDEEIKSTVKGELQG